MLTVQAKRTTPKGTCFEATIILTDGRKAGTGYAGTVENAIYFAGRDAIDAGHIDAGNFHVDNAETLAKGWL